MTRLDVPMHQNQLCHVLNNPGFALQSKTFALSYDEKIKTLINELNLDNIDIYSYSQKELDKKLSEFFKNTNKKYTYRKFDWNIIESALN
jgi:polysaccharide pyruvyl transferase WcaK-like protein